MWLLSIADRRISMRNSTIALIMCQALVFIPIPVFIALLFCFTNKYATSHMHPDKRTMASDEWLWNIYSTSETSIKSLYVQTGSKLTCSLVWCEFIFLLSWGLEMICNPQVGVAIIMILVRRTSCGLVFRIHMQMAKMGIKYSVVDCVENGSQNV